MYIMIDLIKNKKFYGFWPKLTHYRIFDQTLELVLILTGTLELSQTNPISASELFFATKRVLREVGTRFFQFLIFGLNR